MNSELIAVLEYVLGFADGEGRLSVEQYHLLLSHIKSLK